MYLISTAGQGEEINGWAGSGIRGHLTCTQGHQGSGVDTMGRGEGTTRRTSHVRGSAVGLLSHRSGKVQVGKPRRRGVDRGHAERFGVGYWR